MGQNFETITLGNEVVISDPCYEIPTWCQIVLDDVKPGEYLSFCKVVETIGWGERVSMLLVVHKDHLNEQFRWKRHKGEVGVDSGQAGIFSFDSYRNDEIEIQTPETTYDGTTFVIPFKSSPGDDWYEKMCRLTLSTLDWGHYSNGVVSRSGIGDGSYDLFFASVDKQVVAMAIEFNVEEDSTIDFDWFRQYI